MISQLSLLVHTFNGYRHLWQGCIQSWEETGVNIPKYFGTDIEVNKDVFKTFTPLFSGEGEWSDRLVNLLHQVPSEYVLYAQEDHWPTCPPPDLNEMMRIVKENDLWRLSLSLKNHYYTLDGIYFKRESKYLISHQPSIWRKDFLLSCLNSNESPWMNEYEGTKRLQKYGDIDKKIAIYNCEWYKHKCVRGKVV
jgi:hypothetical protein